MDEGRIAHVRKIEKYNKKYVDSLNLILNIQKERETKSIRIDKQVTSDRRDKSIIATKHDVIRRRVLQECLRMKCDPDCGSPYGQYGGKSVLSFTPEIEKHIVEMHPKERRIRQANMLKNVGKIRGAIFTNSGYRRKVDEFFSSENDKSNKSNILAGNRKIQGLITQIYGESKQGQNQQVRASLKLPPIKVSEPVKMVTKH